MCGTDLDKLGTHKNARYCSYRCNKRSWIKNGSKGISREQAIGRLKEPVPVAPFLQWADRRMRVLAVEYDDGKSATAGIAQLMDDIGWPYDAGVRRFYRWRNDKTFHGFVERAVVEDALWRAGVHFWEVYDDAELAA